MSSEFTRQLLRQLEVSYIDGTDFLQQVNPLAPVNPQGWRVKDVIGHLSAWEIEVELALQAYRLGESYCIHPSEREHFDAQQMAHRLNWPFEVICKEWAKARVQLRNSLLSLSLAQFGNEMLYPTGEIGLCWDLVKWVIEHQVEHFDEIVRVAHIL